MGGMEISEESYRALIEVAPVSLVIADEKGTVRAANAEFERLFGWRRDEILGQSIEVLVPPPFRLSHVQDRAAYYEHPRVQPMGRRRDLTAVRKDGSEIPVEIGLSPMRTGDGLLVVAMIVDLTYRKQVEQEIRRREEALHIKDLALSSSLNGVVLTDAEGRITYANPSFLAMWGCMSPSEVVGMSFSSFWKTGDGIEEAFAALSGGRGWKGEAEAVRMDETVFPAGISASVVKDDAGNPLSRVFNLVDVSDQKLAEERLKELTRLKSTFVATVSHELRTPLAVIRLAVDNVLDGILGNVGQAHRIALEHAQRNIGRLERLIENLLDISRIEAGSLPILRRKTDLGALAQAAVDSLAPLAAQHGRRLTLLVSQEEISGEVDSERITDVLTNLIGNALRFARDEVAIRISSVGNSTRIVIEDDGPGVPDQKIGRLFERFVRIEEHAAKSGTGLGLSITKGVVEAHGGEIRAENRSPQEGGGLRFSIDLPAAAGSL